MPSGSHSSKDPQTTSSPRRRHDGELASEPAPQARAASPVGSAHLSWQALASLSLPGENAVLTLHDGRGRFLDATPNCASVWSLPLSRLRETSLPALAPDPAALASWLLGAGSQPTAQPLELAFAGARRVRLIAIPLFVAADPADTRVAVKAVPCPLGESSAPQAFPQNSSLASVHNFDGAFFSASPAWRELARRSEAELQGLGLADFVHPDDAERLQNFLYELREADSLRGCILRFLDAGGAVRSLLVSARLDDTGCRIVADAKDITVEGANPAMDLLKTSVELVNESVLLLMKVGHGFRICYANRAFENMTGRAFASVTGAGISCLNGPQTSAEAILEIEQALASERELQSNILLYRKNGDAFWSNAYLFPLRDSSGAANYFTVILEDASEVRAVTDQLAKKNDELQAALRDLKETQRAIIQQESLRALGQMASGIAHDFNNLLAPILGFSELLLTVPTAARDEAKLASYLKKIQTAAQDGAAVVSRLREFYRSQNSPEEFMPIQPEELLWQVKELTRHRWKNQAEANGISIQFHVEIESSRCIMGNEPELRGVFTNLIINAVDAMTRDGDITIRVSDANGKVRIEIIDTGSGMTDETRRKCLEPFYTTKGKLGTGLGLSIVFGVVQRHRGEFAIDSKLGEGTRIRMDFPSIDDGKQDAPARSRLKSKSLRIMLVDDEEVLLEVISELLASGGHIVDAYSDPNEALRVFETSRYDLVITDRAMPLMSGDQLAATLKDIRPETPIYMITGFGDLIKESGDMPANIDEVLAKPVPLDVLNRKLAELAAGRN